MNYREAFKSRRVSTTGCWDPRFLKKMEKRSRKSGIASWNGQFLFFFKFSFQEIMDRENHRFLCFFQRDFLRKIYNFPKNRPVFRQRLSEKNYVIENTSISPHICKLIEVFSKKYLKNRHKHNEKEEAIYLQMNGFFFFIVLFLTESNFWKKFYKKTLSTSKRRFNTFSKISQTIFSNWRFILLGNHSLNSFFNNIREKLFVYFFNEFVNVMIPSIYRKVLKEKMNFE